MDYKDTLNLLKTDFPQRGNLPKREPEILKFWQDEEIYEKVRALRAESPKWILHDGPPYANGDIHLGQALNKILKDIAIKYKTMRGYDCPYRPGWDTQGLPTEQSVAKEYGINRHDVPVLQWRQKCRELALGYVDTQREQFKRLGVRGDWDNPYLTLSPEYQSRQIEAFAEIADRGLLTRSLRPVYWCYHCETALAEDEIEYTEKVSPAIYVAFALEDSAAAFPELPKGETAEFVIWTTTPWTIPGNTALAVNEWADYVLVHVDGRYLVMAQRLMPVVLEACELGDGEVIATREGADLEGLVAQHPLYDRQSPVVVADYVELESGTGVVHTAPGHGPEDYQTALEYDLDIVSPLDDYGQFTGEAGKELEGLVCDQNNDAVMELLDAEDVLLGTHPQTHEYPHCWRCHNPVIWRATRQWFMDIDALREDALEEIKKAEWMPEWGERRIAGMVESRPDWCISRQRPWGVPIPIFYCADCEEPLLDKDVMLHLADLVEQHSADVWFEREADELVPDGTTCECGGKHFYKDPDIMSVWFDSGASHHCVLEADPELSYPADLYLEGDDQYQCWFQTSLWVAVAMGKPAPFKMVVGHSFFVDETGEKMSKSKGNIIAPDEIYDEYGADVLRMWFTYADFRQKMFASEEIHHQVADAYKKIRFTVRFMLQNCSDFDPETDAVPYEEMAEVDQWALARLQQLIQNMTEAFDNWELHSFYHQMHSFCATDLSQFYLNVCKDRLYTDLPDSQDRRSAQTALWTILQALVRMMAPVLTYTSEEIWQHLRDRSPSLKESVQLADWPEIDQQADDPDLLQRWEQFLQVRHEAMAALEEAKESGECGNPLEAWLTIYADEPTRELLESFDDLRGLMIVSTVELRVLSEAPGKMEEGFVITAEKNSGEKCERCWMRLETVGTEFCSSSQTLRPLPA
ncbi:MAG: isoleucine--tRNA ligase, partial [Armatimonadota bacterium]